MQNPPAPLTDELHALADAREGADCDGFALLEAVDAAAGHLPPVRELLAAVRRWGADAEAGNARPLQVYLGLPATSARRRRYLRDLALREAAQHIEAAGPWTRAVALEREWARFVACPAWACTLDRSEPPPEFGALRRSLWLATKYGGGKTLTARQLSGILGAT